jgi:hypothetical protein
MAKPMTAAEFIGQGSETPTTSELTSQISAGKVKELYDKGTKATRTETRNLWINRSFLGGEQWIVWNDQQRRPQTASPDPDGRLRITIDRLLPCSRTIIAKLLRRQLVFQVPATSSDDDANRGARKAQAVLAHCARDQNWEGLREEAGWAMWQGGTGLLCLDWDAAAGQPLGQTVNGRDYGTGDVCATALAVNEATTQPGTRDIERAQWWIKSVALPPEVVQETYRLPKVPKPDASAALSPLQFKLLRSDRSDSPMSLTLVLTYYERPNRNNKAGQVAVVVDGRVVQRGAWPFPFKDRLNVVAMRETRILGSWTGDTVLSKAVSPQVALNHVYSSIVEHSKKAGNARLFVPEGSLDIIDSLSDEPGEVVPYHAAPGIPPPGYQSPPNLPSYLENLVGRLEAEIDDMLGVHDISRGEAPSGVHAGVALQLLSAQDDTPLGRMAKEMAEGFGRFATLVLQTYAAKVKNTRKARVQTNGQRPEEVKWTGSDLSDQTEAEVPLEAVQPRSRDASLQFALQLKQEFPDLPMRVFATIADLPGTDDLLAGVSPAVEKARRENHELAIGIVCIPADFDDHALHIEEHNRFRMSERYESLPQAVRNIVDDHVQAHETKAAEEAALQQAKASVHPALAAAAQAGQPPGSMGGPNALPSPPPMPPGMPPEMAAPPGGDAPPPDLALPPQ